MKWLIIGGEEINITEAFIEGALSNFDTVPADIDEIVTTLRGGIDLTVEGFADMHEIKCNSVGPDWNKDSANAPTILAAELCSAVDRILVIYDGEYGDDGFIDDIFDLAKTNGVVLHEVVLATNV